MQLNWLLWLAGTTTELYTLKADSSSKIEAKHLFAELHFFWGGGGLQHPDLQTTLYAYVFFVFL